MRLLIFASMGKKPTRRTSIAIGISLGLAYWYIGPIGDWGMLTGGGGKLGGGKLTGAAALGPGCATALAAGLAAGAAVTALVTGLAAGCADAAGTGLCLAVAATTPMAFSALLNMSTPAATPAAARKTIAKEAALLLFGQPSIPSFSWLT